MRDIVGICPDCGGYVECIDQITDEFVCDTCGQSDYITTNEINESDLLFQVNRAGL